MEPNQYVNWIEVNLTTLQNNIKQLEEISQRPVMTVVKANAYGHGLVEIARAAYETGTQWFGVARLEEALQLRAAGIDRNLLVLGYTPPGAVKLALAHHIQLSVFEAETVKAYATLAAQSGHDLLVQAKIDSGMGRLGVFPEDGLDFIGWLNAQQGIQVAGMFTHFARADEPDEPATSQQIERFDRLVKDLEEANLRPPLVHASNSGATVCFPQARYDLMRPGILMYGLSPSAEVPLPEGIAPVMAWKTRLTSVKTLPAGHGVSYGHQYVTAKAERIGALAVGYADGFRRTTGNVVLIRGQRMPVVGRVCMDQTMVSLEAIPECQPGEEVVLLGRQGEAYITAEEIATRWGTINYEVVAGIAARVQRIYTY